MNRSHRSVAIQPHPDHEEYVQSIGKTLPPLLNPLRVATVLDISRRRVYELVATGDLAAVRHGKRGLRIFRESLMQWLARGGSGPGFPSNPPSRPRKHKSSLNRTAGKDGMVP